MWAEKNKRAIKFFTARPEGVLRGTSGCCYKSNVSCSAFYKYTTVTGYLASNFKLSLLSSFTFENVTIHLLSQISFNISVTTALFFQSINHSCY